MDGNGTHLVSSAGIMDLLDGKGDGFIQVVSSGTCIMDFTNAKMVM